MYQNIRSFFLLAVALVPFATHADDVLLDIRTDLHGKFYLVEQAGSSNNPTLVIKSVSGDYSDYSKREFDCSAHTARFLSTGKSLQALVPINPESSMSPIEPDSINDQLSRLVCPE
jgi:hypothetical protein